MDVLASKKLNILKLVENSFTNKSKKHILGIIGYGSSVIQQKGNVASMLDLIFIVDDAKKFHYYNLIENKSHYNLFSKIFGYSFPSLMNIIEPSIYFNHSVVLRKSENDLQKCKYGIISLNTLNKDLIIGNNFFTLGRLQKPFVFNIYSIKYEDEILKIFNLNKKQAFYIGLLCTDLNKFDIQDSIDCDKLKFEILYNILNLSYIGDIRFYLRGEKKSKVKDMLNGSFNIYYNHFHDEFEELFSLLNSKKNHKYNIIFKEYLNKLPNSYICKIKMMNYNYISNESFKDLLANCSFIVRKEVVFNYLKKINFKMSLKAFVINTFTSKFSKGVFYLLKKIRKAISK